MNRDDRNIKKNNCKNYITYKHCKLLDNTYISMVNGSLL